MVNLHFSRYKCSLPRPGVPQESTPVQAERTSEIPSTNHTAGRDLDDESPLRFSTFVSSRQLPASVVAAPWLRPPVVRIWVGIRLIGRKCNIDALARVYRPRSILN